MTYPFLSPLCPPGSLSYRKVTTSILVGRRPRPHRLSRRAASLPTSTPPNLQRPMLRQAPSPLRPGSSGRGPSRPHRYVPMPSPRSSLLPSCLRPCPRPCLHPNRGLCKGTQSSPPCPHPNLCPTFPGQQASRGCILPDGQAALADQESQPAAQLVGRWTRRSRRPKHPKPLSRDTRGPLRHRPHVMPSGRSAPLSLPDREMPSAFDPPVLRGRIASRSPQASPTGPTARSVAGLARERGVSVA